MEGDNFDEDDADNVDEIEEDIDDNDGDFHLAKYLVEILNNGNRTF